MDETAPTIPPIPTPEPSQVPPFSPTPKINWLIPLVFLVLGILVGAGGVLGYQNLSIPSVQQVSSPSPEATSESESTTLSMAGTLQDFMKENCKPGNPPYIDIQQLPVSVDTNIIEPFQAEGVESVYCSSAVNYSLPIQDGYLVIRQDSSNGINIYDDQSKEGGHGGAPFLGSFGQKIFDENGILITAWLGGGDGPQILGQVGIALRGVKQFATKDGHPIYVNYSLTGIPGSDQRLIDRLTPYSSIDPALGLDEPTVNYDPTTSVKIIDYFFGETPNSISPEGQALKKLRTILSGVKAK